MLSNDHTTIYETSSATDTVGIGSTDGTSGTQPRLHPLLRIVVAVAFLLTVRYVVPPLVEDIQYRLTRGRQRAEYETAGPALQSLQLRELSMAFQVLSQRVGPSVVHIQTTSPLETKRRESSKLDLNDKDPLGDSFEMDSSKRIPQRGPDLGPDLNLRPDPFDPGTGRHYAMIPREQGSGVVIDAAGYIVTNYHVVASGASIQVTLSDGRRFQADLIGQDLLTDVALLKIEAEGLIPAEWGDSAELNEGALVWAIGSPFGLKRSITSGIVSATDLAGIAGHAYQDYIQTDAAVNPGSSGGPLVNVDGRIVGINTAIIGESYRGISFAVPSNVVRRVCQQIRSDGHVDRGWLGVQLGDVIPGLLEAKRANGFAGAYVDDVLTSDRYGTSPAATAGIQRGDIITTWDGQAVARKEHLIQHVGQSDVGSTVEVEILRDGESLTFHVTVGQRPRGLLF